MQTQHKVQLDERDANPGLVRPPVGPYSAPGHQAMGMPPPAGAVPQVRGAACERGWAMSWDESCLLCWAAVAAE